MKTAKKTRRKPDNTIPQRYTPRFWSQADSRLAVVRELQRRFDDLQADCNADSFQKKALVGRAVFLLAWMETTETRAIEDGVFDSGSYTQSVNALLGLMKALGLNKASRKVQNLRSYVEGKKTA